MEAKREQVGKRIRGDLIAVVVVLFALVLVAGYYQQELFNFWRLQGWNTGAVKQTTERFVREAYDGQTSAGELLDPGWCQPVVEGGKLVGVRHQIPGVLGPTTTRFKDLLPAGEVKDCRVRIKNRSGVYQADVQFPNGKWGLFEVARVKGALRIRTVPGMLSSTQPQPHPWD